MKNIKNMKSFQADDAKKAVQLDLIILLRSFFHALVLE